jgi:thiaminase/transcriptional activator TenA
MTSITSQTTTDKLIEATREIWKAYNDHPFVTGIGEGSLDREKFRYYIMQDFWYLKDYTKVFAIGLAKATNVENINLFAQSIAGISAELNVHNGFMAQLDITEEELDTIQPSLDNLSYTSYMLRVAYEETEVEILAAILSCAYSYEMIAKEIMRRNPDAIHDDFYGSWIQAYGSDTYAASNQTLIESLNRLSQHYTDAQIDHLVAIFTACSRYELAFWEMSWQMQ